jgi:acetylornithine deacetylase/succinyl-diaminopimelate desuccinylase-like protein
VLAALLEPTLGFTFAPTRVSASEKINVIPARTRLQVDCRVPPGLGEDEVRADLKEVLGDLDDLKLTFHGGVIGNRSPMDTALMDAIATLMAEEEPGAKVVPTVLPGFTDSRWFRDAFPDCIAYGFFPHREMSMLEVATLIHGADERIDLRDLALAARCYHELPKRLLG